MKREAMRVSLTLLLEHYDTHYLTGFVLTGLTATIAIGLAHYRIVRRQLPDRSPQQPQQADFQ